MISLAAFNMYDITFQVKMDGINFDDIDEKNVGFKDECETLPNTTVAVCKSPPPPPPPPKI